MRILCWQTILMKYHSLFLLKTRKDVAKFVAKFVVFCSRGWRFEGFNIKTTGGKICLFDLILSTQSTIFQLCRDGPSWVEPEF